MDEDTTRHDAVEALPDIAGYRLSRVLGHGGMSTVYLGRQLSLGREVAVKVMLPEALTDETSRRRFENEARTIARLDHPNIVGIFEVGRTKDGLPYYAMPYLPRGHLGQRDLTGNPQRMRATLQTLLSALGYAHARGVVHRDVKAENVLFNDADRPMLADFGIALRRGFGTRVTTAGLAVGSTAYMAPEQARGNEVDQRADLYSLGVLGWEMLTGTLPFNAGDALSMAVKHAQDPVPRLPPALRHWQRFFDRALAKVPIERYADAQEMLQALQRVPEGGNPWFGSLRARLDDAVVALRRRPFVAAAALLAVAVVVGALLRQGDERTPEGSPIAAASTDDPGLPVPEAVPNTSVVADPTDTMLRAAPESAAQRWVLAASQQLRRRNLTAPAGANAYDSLMTAWRTDPTHVALPALTASAIAALADDAERALRQGQDARASDLLDRATRLAEHDRRGGREAMLALRRRMARALVERVAQAEAKYDRAGALRAAAGAQALGVDAALAATLRARAQKIPQAGDKVSGEAGEMSLLQSERGMVAIAHREIGRDAYAAFARASQRTPALCRERASPLRLLAPRTWQAPGFEQSASQPVVCVSWQDADAYARWLSQRSGHRYRLPNAAEARKLAAQRGAKPVAEWLSDCGQGCAQRLALGQTWRGASGARPLEAARGYDDVGFRLVRDL